MVVQVRGVVHVVAAQDTMTANSADGMSILVLGMGDFAEAAFAGSSQRGQPSQRPWRLPCPVWVMVRVSRSSTVVMWFSPFGIGILNFR